MSSELAHSPQERRALRETRDAFPIVDDEYETTIQSSEKISEKDNQGETWLEKLGSRVGYDAALHLHCIDKVMNAFASPHHSHNNFLRISPHTEQIPCALGKSILSRCRSLKGRLMTLMLWNGLISPASFSQRHLSRLSPGPTVSTAVRLQRLDGDILGFNDP